MEFVEIPITPDMVQEAEKMSQELGVLKNSIRSGQGNLAGFLGELCFLKHYAQATRFNNYDHDIVLKGCKVEVKTKDRTVVPRLDYECSIALYNTRQKTDFYFFVSLLRQGTEYKKGYLLGYLRKDEYFAKARLLRKGELDPSNNFTVRADCWNLPISELKPTAR